MDVTWTRIITTASGGSAFAEGGAMLELAEFAPPAPPLNLTPLMDAKAVRFILVPPGWDSPPHPAPARQWVVMVSGAVESTTSDGETRRFVPGDAVLVEDVAGLGHRTRCVSDEPWLAMVVALA
jgi:quercetin dioxygenase-like cupin family protein